jgi:hypothetical protein
VQAAALVLGAAVVGTLAWGDRTLALPLAMAFPALWGIAPTRIVAAAIAVAYFLAASRGLPQGVANFYGSGLLWGGVLWIGASLAFVGAYAALWSPRPGWRRAGRFGAASILMAVPPLGIVGWAHPLTAAGVLFPGWGWTGLAAAAGGMLALTTRMWPAAAAALCAAWLWSAASWTTPSVPDAWTGVDMTMGAALGRRTDLEQHRELLAKVRRRAESGGKIVVMPESTLGLWTPTVERFWNDALRGAGIVVIAGAAVVDRQGYDNVLVEIGDDEPRIVYRERMPVPVSMWQPWLAWFGKGGSARAHLFANPVVTVQGRRLAPLICYEQLLLWPVLQSMLHAPDVIVATGNGWWTAGTSIVGIQRASVQAWSRLFDRPLVTAFNL